MLVRHGESEGNVAFLKQEDDPTGRAYDRQAMFCRPDWQHRLTPKGEVEAQRAGDFLLNEGLLGGSNSNSVGQTGYYTSPYVRATETAGFLAPKAHWHTEEWLAERDWGAYGAKMSALRGEDFPYDNYMEATSRYQFSPTGGEPRRLILLSLRWLLYELECSQCRTVVMVTHGDLMQYFRALIENWLPEELDEVFKDKSQSIPNGGVLVYRHDSVSCQRAFADPAHDDGAKLEWVKFAAERTFTGQELLERSRKIPRLY